MSDRDGSARRRLFAALRRAHWRVEIGGKGHVKIWNPRGVLITTTPSSPSCRDSLNALRRDLRRAGFQLPGQRKPRRTHTEEKS